MKGNKLLPLLLISVVGIVTVLLYANNHQSGEQSFMALGNNTPQTPAIDADLPQNTLDRLAVDSAALKEKIQGYSESMTAQEQQLHQLTEILKQMREENASLKQQLQQQASNPAFDAESLKHELLGSLEERMQVFRPTSPDYPVGVNAVSAVQIAETSTRIRSVNSADTASAETGKSALQTLNQPLLSATPAPRQTVPAKTLTSAKAEQPEITIDPRYTIPANAILDDSVTVTALIGRVPVRGDISDPAPFKIVIGSENLAANGFRIPGLYGMIMSGTVFGDAVLSCVRTRITSATYIFEDGRALTIPGSDTRNTKPLGYLTDAWGNPCIAGQYVSNTNRNTALSVLAGTASGAATAFAENEVTTQATASGSLTRAVTGDSGDYVLGQAIAGGTRRMTDYLDRQQFDEWAAVVVPNGIRVAAHIERNLELDNSSQLRKIVYENDNTSSGLTD